jgi:catechol 2,3-dioxygenase-like lactoylglutathione lyase family enzyme
MSSPVTQAAITIHNSQVIDARFGHVNLIARDWRALATFYERVLGCTPVPPERDLRGSDLSAATGVPNAVLHGVHLRLPGGGPLGPTLEIFQYDPSLDPLPTASNRPGFGHVAFVVSEVHVARSTILAEGGGFVGEVITTSTADGRRVTWAYVTDPEGNIVELQSWSDS